MLKGANGQQFLYAAVAAAGAGIPLLSVWKASGSSTAQNDAARGPHLYQGSNGAGLKCRKRKAVWKDFVLYNDRGNHF